MRTLHSAFLLIFLSLWGADTHAARLQLSWTDNSLNELGFSIERRQGGGETFSVIATQEANVESYADHELLPATAYCYRVRAFNDAGYSGYSNESCTTTSPIEMSFEGPSDTQSVAGLGVIRGWSFDARLGQQIKELKLFIDDAQVLTIPCCSPRGDVQAGFPQLPAQNTLNSGWGSAVNWGALASGTHVVQLRAESTSGQTLATDRHTITTVRFAEFSFVDLFSLAQAAVWIDGNDLVVERVVVRDKNSQRQAQVTMRLRWLTNEQSFRIVATETTAHAAAPHAVLSPVLAALRKWFSLGPAVAAAQSSTPILGMIESPGFGQVSAGIGVLRGWAFSGDSAATIRTIQAFVDGRSIGTLPCCSARGDVGASFPNYPAASNSGWGAVVNFGALPTGAHTISVQVTDSRGMTQAFERQIATIRIGDATFVDDLSLTDATARIEDEDLVVDGVHVRDAATQETSDVTLRLRWVENSQSLGIIAATAQ